MEWLDLARYSDTHGYHIDSLREMWPWRDWVIKAYNQNMPYDQFTIEQLAGDLLPNATLDDKIATGFNRNNMINFEGGAVPQEYHAEYVIDRASTTGTAWLGLTVGCARCHDHKFDPIRQKDFYRSSPSSTPFRKEASTATWATRTQSCHCPPRAAAPSRRAE